MVYVKAYERLNSQDKDFTTFVVLLCTFVTAVCFFIFSQVPTGNTVHPIETFERLTMD